MIPFCGNKFPKFMLEYPPSFVVSIELKKKKKKKSFKPKFLLINFYVRIYSWTLRFVRFIVEVCESIWLWYFLLDKFLLINFYVRIYSWTLRFVRFIVEVCESMWLWFFLLHFCRFEFWFKLWNMLSVTLLFFFLFFSFFVKYGHQTSYD